MYPLVLSISIIGEGSVISGPKKGKSCFFPFEYKGVQYTKCTIENSERFPWCATDAKYSKYEWGYCNCPFGIKKVNSYSRDNPW